MANIDEQAVKTRLLLDGDGGGDDRRLNSLAKQVSFSTHSIRKPLGTSLGFHGKIGSVCGKNQAYTHPEKLISDTNKILPLPSFGG